MEEENNMEKKRQIRLAIIGVVALLLLTLGATFAYFLINTDNSTSKSQINVDIEAIDSIALQKVTENLHVNLSSVDMAEANQNTEYYGDDEADYVKTLDEGMHNLGKLTAKGGNGKTRYMCTANAVITMQVASENDMGKFFNTGDAYLYLNAGSLQQRIDLSELKTSGTMTIPFEIGIISESERQIDGYVEIINRDDDQTYLANKTLNIDVTFQDLDCNVGVSKVETYLRDKDTDKKLTNTLINGLYRYQGNSIVTKVNADESGNVKSIDKTDTVSNNYICLGSDCSTENGNDMYRIIGITEDGILKIIKNIPIEKNIKWHNNSYSHTNFAESDIYKYLNTDYYNELPTELKNKIIETSWKYGEVNDEKMDIKDKQKMMEYLQTIRGEEDLEVKKESAKNITKLYSDFFIKEESKLSNKIIGNISLMNLTDYCSSFESDKELNCMSSMVATMLSSSGGVDGSIDTSLYALTWMTPKIEWDTNDGSGWDDNSGLEWTMVRSLFDGYSDNVWAINGDGLIEYVTLIDIRVSRPVFFLTNDIELSGEGTIDNPFTIGIE